MDSVILYAYTFLYFQMETNVRLLLISVCKLMSRGTLKLMENRICHRDSVLHHHHYKALLARGIKSYCTKFSNPIGLIAYENF